MFESLWRIVAEANRAQILEDKRAEAECREQEATEIAETDRPSVKGFKMFIMTDGHGMG